MSKILADFSKSLHLGPHQAPMQGDGGLRLRAHPKQWTDDPPKKTRFFWRFLERPSPIFILWNSCQGHFTCWNEASTCKVNVGEIQAPKTRAFQESTISRHFLGVPSFETLFFPHPPHGFGSFGSLWMALFCKQQVITCHGVFIKTMEGHHHTSHSDPNGKHPIFLWGSSNDSVSLCII